MILENLIRLGIGSLLLTPAAKAESIQLNLEFHVEVHSVADCESKLERAKRLAEAVSSTQLVVENPETFCQQTLQSREHANPAAAPLPFPRLQIAGATPPPPAPVPPASTDGEEKIITTVDFTLSLDLASYEDCVVKVNEVDRFAVEVGASENVNGTSGSGAICRTMFPDLTSISESSTGSGGP